jgi:hypothetical protein
MRRPAKAVLGAAVVTGSLLLAPDAGAGTRTAIEFTDVRTVESPTGTFSSAISGCDEGITEDVRAHASFTPDGGVFVALRDFQCADGGGFVVRLTAKFGEGGSAGTWSIVDSYGDLAGLRGSGTLVGTPIDDGISDHYEGWATWAR